MVTRQKPETCACCGRFTERGKQQLAEEYRQNPIYGTEAWAVISKDGEIWVDTVSSSRRAALVNWLVTDRFIALGPCTDEQIEKMWSYYSDGAVCERVSVERAPAQEQK